MLQKLAESCTNLRRHQRNVLVLQPTTSRRVCYVIRCASRIESETN